MSLMQRALWWQIGVIYHIYPRSFQDMDSRELLTLRAGARQRQAACAISLIGAQNLAKPEVSVTTLSTGSWQQASG
jgi:hypothetical protein